MSDLIIRWSNIKQERQGFEDWQDLPNGKKYNTSTMEISESHCKLPQLSRMGQKVCGGDSYWETTPFIDRAIRKYLVKNWDEIYPKILNDVKIMENDALLACQKYIDDMQVQIDGIEK